MNTKGEKYIKKENKKAKSNSNKRRKIIHIIPKRKIDSKV